MPEDIQSLPLMQRRRILGYAIPAVNGPLFLYNFYVIAVHFQEGMTIGSPMFWEDFIVLILTGFLTYYIPQFFPVYDSKYSYTNGSLSIKRLLRKDVLIPYKSIDRVEVYLRIDAEIDEGQRNTPLAKPRYSGRAASSSRTSPTRIRSS